VVVRNPTSVHLMSTWDQGVPEEIPRAHLYGSTWNPLNLVASMQRIAGLAEARRVGIDGMSPVFAGLLAEAFPKAELVDATDSLVALRRIKSADELACIETCVALAEGALAEVLGELRPGVSERSVLGRFLAAAARAGVTTPSFEGSFCAAPRDGASPRRIALDRVLSEEDALVCDVGLLYAGYEGGVGRTRLLGEPSAAQRETAARARDLRDALVQACRPEAALEDLVRVYEHAGVAMPAQPIAYGLGLGMEPPVVRVAPSTGPRLAAGMVLSVTACISEPGAHAHLLRDVVHVGLDGPRRLTRLAD
jgi:Xaa-Pro aminopeptidase